MIQHILFDGREAIQASNGELEMLIIPSFGSNVISLKEMKTGQELLVKPESFEALQESPILHGIPVLFPPNRIEGGAFTFNGMVHQFPINEMDKHHIHGFVYNQPWTVTAEKNENGIVAIETSITLEEPAVYKGASLQLTYTLDGSCLHQEAVVRNNGHQPFPWGIGYHTAFLFDEEHALFSLTKTKQWVLNDESMPTGEQTEDAPMKRESLKSRALDDAFEAADSGNKAVLANEQTGCTVTYETDSSFRHWVVYNGNGEEGFLCPEPYTCITNAFNMNLPADRTGLRILNPSEESRVKTSITVTRPQ